MTLLRGRSGGATLDGPARVPIMAIRPFNLFELSGVLPLTRHCVRIAVIAALTAAAPLSIAAAQTIAPPSIESQLPRTAAPVHYAIAVVPDAANMRFTARVAIDVNVVTMTSTLVMNQADLTVASATVTGAGGQQSATIATDSDAQTLTLTVAKPLKPGRYRLDITYAGIINDQANGLFALDYKDPTGAQKRALFTQFEAPDARRFVPSWDEPYYKATFDLTATVPTDQMAVSNMPVANRRDLGNGSAEVRFATTPKMSSYLLFFGLGELERISKMAGKTEVGVVVGKGNSAKAAMALDALAEILPYYNDYFGIDYPLPKLDNVAGPGQSQFFGAMENWGAIFTFERGLLLDPATTSEERRRYIYSTTAHETAHMWFGDLVTMAWWDDLWLNEGFASWMDTKTTIHFKPEWQAELVRVKGREQAMALDAFATTHPVVQHVKTVEQTSQAFDSITYDKGEAVITMLEAFAGDEVWRDGLRAYMKKHAYGSTVTNDLWAAVEAAGAKGLVSIADSFTRQPGIPLVKVEQARCDNGSTRLTLSQGEYSRDLPGKTPLSWKVPVIAQTAGGAPVRTILSGKGEMTLPGCGAYNVNVGQTGYYRTLYPAANIAAIGGDFGKFAAVDQLGLVRDNWALALGGYQSIALALDIALAIPDDASPQVLVAKATTLGDLYDMTAAAPTVQAEAKALAVSRLEPIMQRIGFDAMADEDPNIAVLRQQLVTTLSQVGSRMVVDEANRRFASLDSNPGALDGPLKESWLKIVAANADEPTWQKLRALANAAPSELQASQAFASLGNAGDPKLAQKALELALTDEPGATTGAAIIAAVGLVNPDLAVDFALDHRKAYEAQIDASSRPRALARLGEASANPATIAKLDDYAARYLDPTSRSAIDQAIAKIRDRVATRERLLPEVTTWLSGQTAQARAVSKTGNAPARR